MASKLPPRQDKPPKLKSVSRKKHQRIYYGSQHLKKTPAWRAFSEFVRRRAGECYSCGAGGDWKKAHAGHYISGNICGKTLFFSEQNVKRQCARCNLFLHGNAPAYALALQREYGSEILNKLDRIRREKKEKGIICRYSKEELKEIENTYKSKLASL